MDALLREQANRGQVLILPQAVAEQQYGDRLTVASLAALEKGTSPEGDTEVRIIHDGTNGTDVNLYIKVRDGGLCPAAADIKCALRAQMQSGKPHIGPYGRFEGSSQAGGGAARGLESPLQACQVEPGGEVFLNRVGNIWNRLRRLLVGAAGSCNAPHHTRHPQQALWALGLLFADDWDLAAGVANFEAAILSCIWMLVVLQVPLSWRKSRARKIYFWLGLEINRRDWMLGISERRAAWLLSWYDRVMKAGMILMRELREALGRMTFLYGTLVQDKAFMAPLFAFLKTHAPGACVQLPLYVHHDPGLAAPTAV